MAVVWQPDNRIRPSPHSPNAWDVDTGPLRAALAGWRTGRPTVAVWGPHGSRVTQQLDRLVWIMADGTRVPIASAGPAQEFTSAPNVLRVGQAVGGVEDVWEVQGNRLKHTWQVPHLVVPDGAVSLAMEGTLILQGVTLATPEGRSAGSIGLYHQSQAAPVMEIARGEAVDDAEGARTHVAYQWSPSLREAANGAVVKDSRKIHLTTLVDADWIRSLQGGFSIDPTISTTTLAASTSFPNQRKSARFPSTGVVLDVVSDGTNLICRVSADGTQTWQTPASGAVIDSGGYYQAHIELDGHENAHLVASTGGEVKYWRGLPTDTTRTAFTWTAKAILQSSAYEIAAAPVCLVWPRTAGGYRMQAWWSWGDGANNRRIKTRGGNLATDGTWSGDASETDFSSLYAVPSGAHLYPSAAPLSGTLNGVAWATGATGVGRGIRFKPVTFDGTTVTGGTEEAVTEAVFGADMGPLSADTQGRAVLSFGDLSANIYVFRRPAGGGVWTDLSPGITGYSPVNVIDTNDRIHLWYRIGGVKRRMYDSSWGSEVVVDSDTTVVNLSSRRGVDGNAVDVMGRAGSGSPYNIVHYRYSLNQPPSKPTGLTRDNYDATQAAVFAWTHVDPDGNAQASRQVQIIRSDTGALVYDSGKVASATQSLTLPSNTLTNPRQYQWRVMTWDTSDVASPWSDYATFHCSVAPTVAITFPATDGDTVTSSEITAQGTISDPESEGSSGWQWWLLDAADTVLWTSGQVASTSAPLHSVTGLANGGSYKLQLQGWDAKGVASPVVTRVFVVSYTAPADPDALTIMPLPGRGSNRITWQASASPTGVESGAYHISRRKADEPDTAYRTLTTNWPTTTYEDHTAASGQEYVYRVLSIGTNGVLSDGTTLTLTGAQTEG